MHRQTSHLRAAAGLAAVLAGGTLVYTQTSSTATSTAYGEAVNIVVTPTSGATATVQSGPLPVATGTAPPAYNNSNSLASASVSVQSTAATNLLTTGVLSVNASSTVPGGSTVDATATVNNVDLDVVASAGLFGIDATEVRATANVTGPCGGPLTATGGTTLVNAVATGSVLGGVSVALLANPPPNYELVNAGGIRVVLNEQVMSGDGTTSRGIIVNAIHVYLTNVPVDGIGVLNGDIIVSHAETRMDCSMGTSADVGVTITDTPDPVSVGGNLTYNITVPNTGPDAAGNVVVVLTLPAGVTIVSQQASQGSCTQSGTTVTCNLGTVPAGTTPSIVVVATPTAAGTVDASVTVTSSTPDPNLANNTATATTTVVAATAPADVGVTITAAPNPVALGGDVTLTLPVTNAGPSPAEGVVLTYILPAGVTFVSATSAQGTCVQAGTTVTCTIGTMATGASVPVTIVVRPTAPGTVTHTGCVAAQTTDPNPANACASTQVDVFPPVPTLSQWAMLLLAGLLGLAGFATLSRRRGLARG